MIISPILSNTLNYLRWVAALLVVIGHLRSLIFPVYTQLINPSLTEKIFYFFTGLGHEAVVIFFVLSGYLVGGEFIKMSKIKKNYYIYFIKRVSRIFIVFIPALLLGGLLDYIGITYFNSSGIYNNAYHFSAMDYSVIDRFSLDILISNMFMMQTSLSPTFGSNGPLWSLANEWWYYILFPALYFTFYIDKTIIKLGSFLFIFMMFVVLNNELLIYFSIWLLGALAFYFRKKVNFPFIEYISFLLLFFAFVISRISFFENNYLHDLFIALTLIFLLNNLSYINKSKVYFGAANKYFADFSYSLYLFHFPVTTLFIAIMKTVYSDLSTTYISTLVIIYVFSIFCYYLFERNTYRLKTYLVQKAGFG